MYGINDSDLKYIIDLLEKHPEIREGVIFGSRALGNYKVGSDVDIALKGENIGDIVSDISAILNEQSPLPYFFDIVDYHALTNTQLSDHIDTVGKIFYKAG